MIVTNERIEAAIGQLDRLIAAASGQVGSRLDAHRLEALKGRRDRLHLLMLARVLERRKSVVNLDRWRYGFEALDPMRQQRRYQQPRSR
ncbi:MAG TPA: hypothetical protein VJ747_19085 [Stellaceae bacterium]|nr:hypothetical protein [Stellaceae bacterium]